MDGDGVTVSAAGWADVWRWRVPKGMRMFKLSGLTKLLMGKRRSYRPEKYFMRGPGPKCRERAMQEVESTLQPSDKTPRSDASAK
jgi:hypothetical protein